MEVSEDKTRYFCISGGFAKRKHVFFIKWGIREEKTRDFCITGGFAKRKCEIFAYMGDLRGENASFSHKWGILE